MFRQTSEAPAVAAVCQSYSLVGLFALRARGARAAVVSLNDEGVFLLQLAVHQAACPQLALTRRTVQHHCLERSLQPVDVERTDLPCRAEGREVVEGKGGRGDEDEVSVNQSGGIHVKNK